LTDLPSHDGEVTAVAFSGDAATLATAGGDPATARAYDSVTLDPVCGPLRHHDTIQCLALAPDGKVLVSGTIDGTVYLWNLETSAGGALAAFRHAGTVNAVAFRPDGRAFATAASDLSTRLWDTASGTPTGVVLWHLGEVRAVTFSADGRVVLTGSTDRMGRLWDARTGRPIGDPCLARGAITCVSFSPDGERFALGSLHERDYFWDRLTRRPLGPLPNHNDGDTILAIAFDARSGSVWTAADDRALRRRGIPAIETGNAERIALRARCETGLEIDGTGSVRVMDLASWRLARERLDPRAGVPVNSRK
jgi:WD40 repeat protein